MSTEELLLECDTVLQMVRRNEIINAGILIAGIAIIALLMVYVYRNWTWIPRKRQRTHFNERF